MSWYDKAMDRLGSIFGVKKQPLINEPFAPARYERRPPINYETLWRYTLQNPELVSIVSAIAEDIITDGWKLEGGRNNKLKAEEFLENNNAKEEFMAMVIDGLVTGDGYLFKSSVKPDQVKDAIDGIVDSLPFQYKSEASSSLYYNIVSDLKQEDEDIFRTRKFISVPSSTLKADFDDFGNVKRWIQRVGEHDVPFTPEEIIHYRYMKINGKFYGFSPMQSLLTEVNILQHIKDMANSYFVRGGLPSQVWILEEETPDSDNYKLFDQQLKRMGADPSRFKNILVTGKVSNIAINPMDKDMEYRELANYITNVIVMAWGIPASRLSDLLIQKGVRGATLSQEGYYRKISHHQDLLEDLINTYLLKEYKVKLKFNRTYKQDEIREIQIEKIKTDIIEQRMNMDIIKPKYAWEYLDIPEELRKTPKKKPELGTGKLNRTALQNQKLLEASPEKLAENTDKQTAALQAKGYPIEEEIKLLEKGYNKEDARQIMKNIYPEFFK